MKRTGAFLLLIFSVLLFSCAKNEVPKEPVSLRAVTLSDLHFTVDPEVISSVVPAMPYSKAATEAIVREVIDSDPDVLIITGDNTNSGMESDTKALAEVLSPVTEAGIPIVMTTGNHDFSRSDVEAYQRVYEPLLTIDIHDPDSLSYITIINSVWLFAMDDSTYTMGASGTYSDATMKWLKQQLNKAQQAGGTVVFLSHHNVIAGGEDPRSETYRITNKGLEDLLASYGVKLCMTGHLHSQSVLSNEHTWEIISGMPLAVPHPIGFLELNENGVDYHAEPIDFRRYGETGLAEAIAEADTTSVRKRTETFSELLEEEGLTGKQKDDVLALILRFLSCYENGTLSDEAESIMEDPSYETMLEALETHNYGPWIRKTLEHPPRNATRLSFEWD